MDLRDRMGRNVSLTLPRNVTSLFRKFLLVNTDSPSAVSYNVAVYKNVSTTLNEDSLYSHRNITAFMVL
jgi:hypothetical protein